MRKAWVFAFFLSASPTIADEINRINLPKGDLTIRLDQNTFEAVVKGAGGEIRVASAFMPTVEASWENSVLLFAPTGGTACPGEYIWITLDENGLSASETFGTCSDLAEVKITAGGPLISMPRMTDGGTTEYLLRNGRIEERELGLRSAGIADPKDAASWIGKTAFNAVTSEELEAELLGIMDWKTLERVRSASSISSNQLAEDGEWVTASGCEPHNCDGASAGIGISRNDGRLIVALWIKGEGGQLFGMPDSALPVRLRSLLAKGY